MSAPTPTITPSRTVFVGLTKPNTSAQSSGTLPFTGYDVGIVVLVGGLMIGLGLVMRRRLVSQL